MPNWVYHAMHITGPEKDRNRFEKYAKGPHGTLSYEKNEPILPPIENESSDLSAHKFIPYPKKYWRPDPKTGKDGYNSGGYEWCNANWGTKWGFCDVEKQKDEEKLSYTFLTAWSVPYPLIEKMSEMFPTLTFNVFAKEESGKFEWTLTFKKGKITTKNFKTGINR